MTVIAYKNGVMAGDGLVSQGGTKLIKNMLKVRVLDDGSIFGCAGEVSRALQILGQMQGGFDPAVEIYDDEVINGEAEDIQVLVITPKKEVWLHTGFPEKNFISMGKPKIYAIGAGSDIALGAMHAGADPVAAVKIACKLNNECGGRISCVSL